MTPADLEWRLFNSKVWSVAHWTYEHWTFRIYQRHATYSYDYGNDILATQPGNYLVRIGSELEEGHFSLDDIDLVTLACFLQDPIPFLRDWDGRSSTTKTPLDTRRY